MCQGQTRDPSWVTQDRASETASSAETREDVQIKADNKEWSPREREIKRAAAWQLLILLVKPSWTAYDWVSWDFPGTFPQILFTQISLKWVGSCGWQPVASSEENISIFLKITDSVPARHDCAKHCRYPSTGNPNSEISTYFRTGV